MSTGKKFRYHGLGPNERAWLLTREIELIDIERIGHREMVAKLQAVLSIAMLSPSQASAVTEELRWRRHALDILREQRHSKSNSLIYLRDRIEDVARRLVREPVNAPQSRTSDCT